MYSSAQAQYSPLSIRIIIIAADADVGPMRRAADPSAALALPLPLAMPACAALGTSVMGGGRLLRYCGVAELPAGTELPAAAAAALPALADCRPPPADLPGARAVAVTTGPGDGDPRLPDSDHDNRGGDTRRHGVAALLRGC